MFSSVCRTSRGLAPSIGNPRRKAIGTAATIYCGALAATTTRSPTSRSLFGVLTLGLMVLAATRPEFALPIAAGMLCGGAIGMVNLRLTRFEWASDGDYYYPHPYVGAALSLLLVGRLAYRYAVLGGMTPITSQPQPTAGQSPLTFGLIAVLLGYYLVYLGGLMIERYRHHRAAP